MSESDPEPSDPLGSRQKARIALATQREGTATKIAISLVIILALTIAAIFVFASIWGVKDAAVVAQIVLPVVATLVGTVLGYYFGSQPDQPA